jgi:hypothetical protein
VYDSPTFSQINYSISRVTAGENSDIFRCGNNFNTKRSTKMTSSKKITLENLDIEDDDFNEWVSNAPTEYLLDAKYDYLSVMENEAVLANLFGDCTDPHVLSAIDGVICNLCLYGPRISDIQVEIIRRHAPVGPLADYMRSPTK